MIVLVLPGHFTVLALRRSNSNLTVSPGEESLPPAPAKSSNGRTFVLSLIIVILVFVVMVIIRCLMEYRKSRRLVQKYRAEVVKKQRFKQELEEAVNRRKERLEQLERGAGDCGQQRRAEVAPAPDVPDPYQEPGAIRPLGFDDIIAV